MKDNVLYLSVIQFYLLNHTQNVISGRNTRVKLHFGTASTGRYTVAVLRVSFAVNI